ncbi:aminotransferase class IV [Bordetella bronchiseptica]|uniref:aminotransferase class IV n=1 Tax=Bordetella bronchiseptica TaxID=518 RepID=UPI001D115B4F|nr:aminotransferase class IV [Bordetella bronchiseptica]
MQPELIETILVTADRQLPLLGRHLARLLTSCQALRYRCNEPAVESAIMAAVRGLHAPGPHRLRLLLARDGSHDIQTAPLAPLPPGQEVMLAPEALDADEPLLRYKTTYRPWYAHTIEWLPSHPRVFDLLYLNQHGELCEGSRSCLADGPHRTLPLPDQQVNYHNPGACISPWYAHTIEWLPSHPRVFDLLYLNQHGELCSSRSH